MLAELILAVHAAVAAFLILGLLLIVLGALRGWCWIRNAWFRSIHMAGIVAVAVLSWLGVPCPLTVWEAQLRQAQGQAVHPEAFMPYWIHRLLFYEFPTWAFTLVYTLFALLVLATWWRWPPRIRSRRAPGVYR